MPHALLVQRPEPVPGVPVSEIPVCQWSKVHYQLVLYLYLDLRRMQYLYSPVWSATQLAPKLSHYSLSGAGNPGRSVPALRILGMLLILSCTRLGDVYHNENTADYKTLKSPQPCCRPVPRSANVRLDIPYYCSLIETEKSCGVLVSF